MTAFHLRPWISRILGSFIALATCTPALAKAKDPAQAKEVPLVTLGLIDAETDPQLPSITIRLNQKPTWTKLSEIQNHGAFLQLTLPGTIVPEPGKFFDGVSPYMPKIAAFQLTPSDAGIRFFINQDAAKTKEALTAEVLGERIVLTLDVKKLGQSVAVAAVSSSPDFIEKDLIGPPAPSAISAEQVIARTAVQSDEPAPSERFKSTASNSHSKESTQTLATGGIDLQGKMVRMAAFSAVMLGLLLVTWLAKPYLKRRAGLKGDLSSSDNLTMKTLSTLALAPRQKISLIQVGNERLLIGISPDQITFLSAIGASTPTPPLRMQHPAPTAVTQGMPAEFTKLLSASQDVEMSPAPVLKNLPGNDPETLASPTRRAVTRPPMPSPHGAPVRSKRPVSGQRINIGVGENGIEDMSPAAPPQRPRDRPQQVAQGPQARKPSEEPFGSTGDGQKAIDDVTRLIREKLKNLRTI